VSVRNPELSIVIPTRDRKGALLETLARLEGLAAPLPLEVIVVDDGGGDGSADAAEELSGRSSLSLRVLRQEALGPASARNRGLSIARGNASLFIGDDVWPRPGMIERHVDFHRRHPEPGAALLGRIVPAPPLDGSEFIRWLHEGGVQFGFAGLDPDLPAPPECFWTANVSAKTSLILEAGGFDESFRAAACEDTELGLRLAKSGMQLQFDPRAVAEHFHPTDLTATLERMRTVGEAFQVLSERAPDFPMPTRPGVRHRVKAWSLTAPYLAHLRPTRIRRASWRFLCDEVQREAYWGLRQEPGAPRVGATLARLAARDPATRLIVAQPSSPT
jgi:GT2 family glycosyltransferase